MRATRPLSRESTRPTRRTQRATSCPATICALASVSLGTLPEPYRLAVAGPAARSLEKLPERIAIALVEFMTGRLLENPQRIGKPLVGRFVGLHTARVLDYRVRCRIDEQTRTVVVHVAARADAYRPQWHSGCERRPCRFRGGAAVGSPGAW